MNEIWETVVSVRGVLGPTLKYAVYCDVCNIDINTPVGTVSEADDIAYEHRKFHEESN